MGKQFFTYVLAGLVMGLTLTTGFDPSISAISLQFIPQILTNIGLGWIALALIFLFAVLGQATLTKSIEQATIGDFAAFLGGLLLLVIPVLGVGLAVAGYVMP